MLFLVKQDISVIWGGTSSVSANVQQKLHSDMKTLLPETKYYIQDFIKMKIQKK